MKIEKFRSIRIKLILLLSISAIIALCLSSIAIFTYVYQTTKQDNITSLINVNNILAKNLKATIEFDDKEGAENLLKTLEIDAGIDGAFIFKEQNKQFASFVRDTEDTNIQGILDNFYKQHEMQKKAEHLGMKNIIVSAPIYLENEYIATFCIVANTEDLTKSVYKQILVQIVVSIISLLIIIFIATKLEKIFTKPIFKLKKIMEEISIHQNYKQCVLNNNDDEFYSLFDGFNTMIDKIHEQKTELQSQKSFVQTLLDSQEQLIITTDGESLLSANATFLDFFAVDSILEFREKYDVDCICERFNTNAPQGYLQIKMGKESWVDYVILRSFTTTHKAMITQDSRDYIFSVTAAKLPGNDGVKLAVFTSITEMENAKMQIDAIHKHTKESIEYASLIQSTLIPEDPVLREYFEDCFTIWKPKDLVGGDIYLFEDLRNKDECLLMIIDCTGHGVAGAFVTMFVKAIERQVTGTIKYNKNEIVSPAKILSIYNKTMKQLLKQENIDSISNAGLDGGILYYNKKEQIIRYSGAEIPLYYIEDGDFKTIKGDRYSVGYKKCDESYEYTEHTLNVKKGMQFYLTTDGYVDQNGGEKSFPMGKKRFKTLLQESCQESMTYQKELLLKNLDEYQGNEERNDDITLIGFKI